jgi:hypothetical protein
MGAVEEMLDATASSPARTWLRYLGLAARFVVGYLIAVAAGAIVFAVIADFVLPGAASPPQRSFAEWLTSTANASAMFFLLGSVFGVPYTLIGLVLFRFLLPRDMATFLIVGALCPGAAIFTVGLVLGGQVWIDPEIVRMTIVTLPSGLAAAYLFGAIGLGYGFGAWRMA